MSKRAQPGDGEKWSRPPLAGARPEAGYAAWLEAEIEAACAELDAGRRIPAERVWRDLGLE
jgi:hypothetical protein